MRRRFTAALAALAALLAGPAGARGDAAARAEAPGVAALCRKAALEAAGRHGVPAAVMLAITLVETRRRVGGVAGPWPWTLNIGGRGAWFDSRAEARAAAEAALETGARQVDLGCFQLNHRWHGAHFADPGAMLDPWANADYAARFLADLHAESGDWMVAAGRYHSRTPEHFERYRGLVERAMAAADPAAAPPPGAAAGARLAPSAPLPPVRPGRAGRPAPLRGPLLRPGGGIALVALSPRAGGGAAGASPGSVRLGPLAPGAVAPLLRPRAGTGGPAG